MQQQQQGQEVYQYSTAYPVLTTSETATPLVATGVQYPTYYFQQPLPQQQQQQAQPPQQQQAVLTAGVKCVNCGNVNDAAFHFCSGCGTQLAPSALPTQQQLPEGKMVDATEGGNSSSCLSKFKLWSLTGVVAITAAVNALLIAIWLLAGHGFPWFLYPLSGTFAVASIVYVLSYLTERRLITMHFLLSANLNTMLFFTYLFAFTSYPWFIDVLFPCLALFALHFMVEEYNNPESQSTLREVLWKIHLFCVFVPVNALLFISCVASDPSLPWFMYPFLVTSCILCLHYILFARTPSEETENKKWFLAHLSVYCHTNVFFFLVWYLAGHGFPWFLFILGITTAIILLHYGLQFHRNRMQPHIQHMEDMSRNALSHIKESAPSLHIPTTTNFTVSNTDNNIQKEGIDVVV